jgi:hypothetical protein
VSKNLLATCHHVHGLSMPEKAVLTALCGYADDDGSSCFPSVHALAADACTSERSVQRALPQLVARGAIDRHDEPGRSSSFRVNVPWLDEHYVAPKSARRSEAQGCQSVTGTGPKTGDTVTPPGASLAQGGDTVAPLRGDSVSWGGARVAREGCQPDTRLCQRLGQDSEDPPYPPVGGTGGKSRGKSPERLARDASRAAWSLVVRELDTVKRSSGGMTWTHAEAAVRAADPCAHAAVLAIAPDGYGQLGRSERREETYRRAFRDAYETAREPSEQHRTLQFTGRAYATRSEPAEPKFRTVASAAAPKPSGPQPAGAILAIWPSRTGGVA